MSDVKSVAKVETEFDYLFHHFDYRVIAHRTFDNHGNWLVVLQSPSCGRLLLLQDRGEVVLALGPHGPSNNATAVPWFDLAVAVEYLSDGEELVEIGQGHPDHQLAQLASTLHPYMEQVSHLFGTGAFEEARPDLDRIGARREQELGVG